MIDLHTHLLPGVDDGARTLDESVRVLERLARQGVTRVVCTPHLRATEATAAPFVRNASLLADLRERVGPVPALSLGWEIMLDRPGADFTRTSLRLGGAAAVLVEFPRSGIPPRAADELHRIRTTGVVPVVAHPERYWGATLVHAREWRAAGAVLQGDATFLLGSGARGELARAMLSQGMFDLLASDNHGDTRSLGPAREWLVSLGATEHAELLTHENARRVLAGETVAPVPPITLRAGVVGRLRELLVRRA